MSSHVLTAKAAAQSLEPPEETWMQILSLLNDKADLLHPSLASKRMQALTIRLLYEHFDLVLAPEIEESLSRVLSTRNSGRDFMRELTLSLWTSITTAIQRGLISSSAYFLKNCYWTYRCISGRRRIVLYPNICSRGSCRRRRICSTSTSYRLDLLMPITTRTLKTAAWIRKVGADSLALLKNNNAAGAGLPLNRPRTISIFGAHAGPAMAGPNFAFSVQGTESDVYQGHLASAVGSGGLSNSYLATPFQALSLRAAQDGSMFRWIMNNTYSDSSSSSGSGGGGMRAGMGGGAPSVGDNSTSSAGGMPDADSSAGNASMPDGAGGAGGGGMNLGSLGTGTTVTPSIANYASDSEVCIVFINSWSGEGADRSKLYDQDQDILINTVAENCNNTIVVINTSGPRVLDQWIENDNVTAVVYGGYLGQESGNAIVDVLYGDVNPNGMLIHTIAKNETDYPVSICYTAECDFDEGVHIDYRYFDANNISVRYPFGHGLSYTTFEYGKVSAAKVKGAASDSKYPTGKLGLGGPQDLFDEAISVGFTLKNIGDVDGAEVVQVYVQYPAGAEQPPRQLRGFEKVALSAGQAKDISIQLRRRDLSYWDTFAQKWALAEGTYTFIVGSSSRDIKGSAQVSVL